MSNFLRDKKIILGITGSIAAYKAFDIIRQLRKMQAQVKVVLTAGAQAFITPLSIQALTQEPVFQHFIDADQEAAMGHIALARWADLLLIAPASAHCLAKLANGYADDLLSTLYLATKAPTIIVPAMNMQMWQHPATIQNKNLLQQRGVDFLGPVHGEQACGDIGPGRLMEPTDLIFNLQAYFRKKDHTQDCHVVITAGPTQEPIDPVRFLSNHSSGKMGYALANAAIQAGLQVTLISGPTHLSPPDGVALKKVKTACEMQQAVFEVINSCQIFIGCAAVADYQVKKYHSQKIKKDNDTLLLELVKNPDIIQSVALRPDRPLVVGFAAETNNIVEYAKQKLQQKKLDFIIANDVSEGKVFGQNDSQASIFSATEEAPVHFPCLPKSKLAEELIAYLLEKWKTQIPTQKAMP